MFGLLLVLHILAMIAVIGPAFLLPVMRRSATTADQLRFAFRITSRLALLPKIGGAVLVVSGVWLMILTKIGLSQMWLNLSLLLSLLMMVIIGGLVEPRTKKLMQSVAESRGQAAAVPPDFAIAMKKIATFELAAQFLMIAITALMIVKPF